MNEERLACGHTEREHEEYADLNHLVTHVQRIEDPRVALIISDEGDVHFASSIPPREAADALMMMANRVRRYGSNYVHDHFDRGAAARWN